MLQQDILSTEEPAEVINFERLAHAKFNQNKPLMPPYEQAQIDPVCRQLLQIRASQLVRQLAARKKEKRS